MARFDCAVWRPIGCNYGGRMSGQLGLILHHQAGNGSLHGFFNNPAAGVSSQFWVSKNGTIEQYVDSEVTAWHGKQLNGRYNGVETEGCPGGNNEGLTEAAVDALGRLMAEGARRHGWRLALANADGQPGLGYHRMAVNTACPCDLRLNRRPDILARAGGSVPPGTSAPPAAAQEVYGNMMITRAQGGYYMLSPQGGVFAKGGAPFFDSLPGIGHTPSAPIIGGAATQSGHGYWLVGRDGMVYAFGDARYLGPAPRWTREWGIGTATNPVVGIAATEGVYALAAARAGGDPADYVMDAAGKFGA